MSESVLVTPTKIIYTDSNGEVLVYEDAGTDPARISLVEVPQSTDKTARASEFVESFSSQHDDTLCIPADFFSGVFTVEITRVVENGLGSWVLKVMGRGERDLTPVPHAEFLK